MPARIRVYGFFVPVKGPLWSCKRFFDLLGERFRQQTDDLCRRYPICSKRQPRAELRSDYRAVELCGACPRFPGKPGDWFGEGKVRSAERPLGGRGDRRGVQERGGNARRWSFAGQCAPGISSQSFALPVTRSQLSTSRVWQWHENRGRRRCQRYDRGADRGSGKSGSAIGAAALLAQRQFTAENQRFALVGRWFTGKSALRHQIYRETS
jgi:hypothetical protein